MNGRQHREPTIEGRLAAAAVTVMEEARKRGHQPDYADFRARFEKAFAIQLKREQLIERISVLQELESKAALELHEWVGELLRRAAVDAVAFEFQGGESL